jgi:hypothetical protein
METENKYAVLMETNDEHCESWYYCIKYKGNEDNLKHLNEQLETIESYILEDMSTFDLELDHLISETTAKELTKLDLNHHSFHRKFDGVLDKIDLRLKNKDTNEKKIEKVYKILGDGGIEDFIDEEDIDEEDLTDTQSSDEEDEDDEDDEEHENKKVPLKKGIPPSLHKNLFR